MEVVDIAMNPIKGKETIEKHQPDLVFLDIEMPYGNAFDLLDKIKPIHFEVIFITAFNNYAIKAFKYAAIDYLLKPVNITELQTAVEKVSRRMEDKKVNAKINILLSHVKEINGGPSKIGLATTDGIRFEDLSNILYLKAEGNYTYVHIKGGVVETVSKSLKDFEDILPDTTFCRVHHSFIVSMNHIKKYFRGRGGYVEMVDGSNIEIAARKRDEFLRRFAH